MPRYEQSPLLGGIGGFLGGLGQGLQTLLALKQAEQERQERDERERRAGEQAFRDALTERGYFLDPSVDIQGAANRPPAPTIQPTIAAEGPGGATSYEPAPGGRPEILGKQPANLWQILAEASGKPQSGLGQAVPLREGMGMYMPPENVLARLQTGRENLAFRAQEGERNRALRETLAQLAAERTAPETFSTLPGKAGQPIQRVGSRTNRIVNLPATHPEEELTRKYVGQQQLLDAAGAAGRAIPAQNILKEIEATDPTLPGRFYQKLARLQGFLPRLRAQFVGDEAVEAELFKSLDAQEQRYWTAGKQFMAGLLRREIGSQQTIQEFLRQKGAWFPGGELKDLNMLKQFSDRRDLEVQNNIFSSMDAFADVWAPRLQEQGYDLSAYQLRGGAAPKVEVPAVEPNKPKGVAPVVPGTAKSLEEIKRELGIIP